MISVQNHQKLGVCDHQFDFGTSASMRSTDWVIIVYRNHQLGVSEYQFNFGTSASMRGTDWVRKYLQGTWSKYKITS